MIENITKGEDCVEVAKGTMRQRRKKKWFSERQRLWTDVGSPHGPPRVDLH